MRKGASIKATAQLGEGDHRKTRGVVESCFRSTGAYAPVVFASNPNNEYQSLRARTCAEIIQPGLVDDAIKWAKKNHKEIFEKIKFVKPDTFDVYLENSNARPAVKKILQETHDRLKLMGVDCESIFGAPESRRWTLRSAFVKVEKLLYRSPAGIKEKTPRLIQGAQPEFIVLVGPWISALQRLFKRRFGLDNSFTFCCGLTNVEVSSVLDPGTDHCAKTSEHADWSHMEDDISAFDSSVDRKWNQYKLWLYKRFGAPTAVRLLLNQNVDKRGRTRFGYKYRVKGSVASGDPDTSLFNFVINLICHLYTFCKEKKFSIHKARRMIRIIISGDDVYLRHRGKRFDWKPGMAGLGFKAETIYRERVCEIEFCSNRPISTKNGYVFCPMPGKVLAKLGYSISRPENVSKESYLKGVALGLKETCHFCPPINQVLDDILFLTQGHVAYFERDHEYKLRAGHVEFHESCYVDLYHIYGWCPQWQGLLMRSAEHYDSIVEALIDRDTGAPSVLSDGRANVKEFQTV